MCFVVCMCAFTEIVAHFELIETAKIQSKIVRNFKKSAILQDRFSSWRKASEIIATNIKFEYIYFAL